MRVSSFMSLMAALVLALGLCAGAGFAAEQQGATNSSAPAAQAVPATTEQPAAAPAAAPAAQAAPATAEQPVAAPAAAPAAKAEQPVAAPVAKAEQPVEAPTAAPAAKADAKKKISLAEALAMTPRGTEPGMIDENAAPGFLGIPGAPQVRMELAFAWAVWVGWIFSTVGAFGGVMASVGHMAVFGFGSYAHSFAKTSPALNKAITDSIRVSNQWLVGTSAGFSSFNYWRMGRLVLPLALALGVGSVFGSWLIPTLTAGKLSFKAYSGYFGAFVLFLGCYLFWETTPAGQATKKKAKAATEAFERMTKECKMEGSTVQTNVKIISVGLSKVRFNFCGVEFSFHPVLVAAGGFIIASLASFLGVGGGFLLVPFLTSVTQLPMYLAAGTSALAVLIGMVTSISTFMTGGTLVHWDIIGVELVGIIIGSYIGPKTSKYLSDKWMKRIFIVLAFYVGLGYVLKGFFGLNWLPV